MCAEKSRKLLRELKTSCWLPPYNRKLIDDILEEVSDLVKEILQLNDEVIGANPPSMTAAVALALKTAILFRHKRCVLAYLRHRCIKLEESRWQSGSKLPSHYQGQLSDQEATYFDRYSRLLGKYSVLSGVDVTRDLEPPKDVQVEVSVTEERGEIELPESGTVELKKNTRLLLRRAEAENLIRQGIVQQTRVG
jgi:GINS complex subunit 1